jgi:hypothetical protein
VASAPKVEVRVRVWGGGGDDDLDDYADYRSFPTGGRRWDGGAARRRWRHRSHGRREEPEGQSRMGGSEEDPGGA